MSLYKFLENTNPLLTIPLTKCSDNLDRKELKENLIETMKESAGVGLSANQCGVMERAFVMYSDVKKKEILACFNPKIVSESDETILMDEGCLSWPGLWLQVRRPDGIEATYDLSLGQLQEIALFGLECRIFQHEMEHLEGENFLEGIGDFALRRAKEKQTKLLEKVRRQKNKLVRQQKKK